MTHVTHGTVHHEQMVTEPLDLVSLDAGGTGRVSVSMTEPPIYLAICLLTCHANHWCID